MASIFGNAGVSDGGLGGMLREQLQNETDETRKRRLLQQQQAGLLGAGAQLSPRSLSQTGGLGAMLGGMTGGLGGRY